MSIINAQIPITTAEAMITVPSSKTYAILDMIFCNTSDTAAVTMTVYCVKSGGSVGNSTMILNDVQINSGDTFTWTPGKLILDVGDSIQAVASSDDVITLTLTYVEI